MEAYLGPAPRCDRGSEGDQSLAVYGGLDKKEGRCVGRSNDARERQSPVHVGIVEIGANSPCSTVIFDLFCLSDEVRGIETSALNNRHSLQARKTKPSTFQLRGIKAGESGKLRTGAAAGDGNP